MHSYINAIGTAVPEFKIDQKNASKWMSNALNMKDKEEKRIHSLYESTGIDNRYSVLEDFISSPENFRFFPGSADLEPFPGVSQRMELYKKKALPLAVAALTDCLSKSEFTKANSITHLIIASCTGMYAPGIDIEIIETLGLKNETERTCIQFMGCYAAFNAIKSADYICRADKNAMVAVVCVELCSIHFQKSTNRDTLVSNALFGDGAAAVLMSQNPAKGLSLKAGPFKCILAPEGKTEMAWQIGDHGFEMTLSSYVPRIIKNGIKDLTNQLTSLLKLDFDDIDYFAIHPGGKRILEVCEEALGITKADNQFSYEILRQYGNMSSATVLFVIDSLLKTLSEADHGKQILSFAFGPGLTMESMLLEVNVR